jgi:hypothetical protein
MPRWQSNFNKNSVTAKLVIEIAVAHRRYPNAKTEHPTHTIQRILLSVQKTFKIPNITLLYNNNNNHNIMTRLRVLPVLPSTRPTRTCSTLKVFFSLILAYAIFQVYLLTSYISGKDYTNHAHDQSVVDINININNDKVCKCVDCEEDEFCGGLWKANRYPGNNGNGNGNGNGNDGTKIHIVVSHCKSNLGWISDFTKGYEADIASIHVITKCGVPVEGAPDNATLEVLPNVGRCDHAYAHYITTILDQKVLGHSRGHGHGHEKDSIVVFLKDNQILHQGTGKQNNFEAMVRLASSSNGFACGVLPTSIQVDGHKVFISAYHEVKKLFEFTLGRYWKGESNTQSDVEPFESVYRNIGALYDSLGAGPLPAEVVQVCYGGIFAASVPNIKTVDRPVWEKVEQILSRGDNIQEGHYMERSWAYLLATPLQSFQVKALLKHSDSVNPGHKYMNGALLKNA